MAKKIKIEQFDHIEVQFPNLNRVTMQRSLETANDLRRNKYQKWDSHRLKPSYNAGWWIEMSEDHAKKATIGTVYNRRQWSLTWLLENGHFIVNKKKGVGWAHPHSHIKDAFDKNAELYKKEMLNLDIKIELK